MKAGSLFSGIGAPELAMPQFDWRWCAEIDPFASAVLAARFPGVPNLGDVTKVDWHAVEPVDLVVFGSPCQSFSVAGKRLGLDDPRGNLALVGLRAVDRVRSTWVVFENVPGILSSLCHAAEDPCPPHDPVDMECDGQEVEVEDEYDSEELHAFNVFLAQLSDIGYGFAFRIFDAQYAGVPQRRERVFVVGHLGDWRPAAAVLFEPESLRGDPAPRREAGEGIAPTVIKGAAIGREPENGPQFGELLDDGTCYTLNCTETHAVVAGTLNARHSAGGGLGTDFECGVGTLNSGGGKPGQGYPAIAFHARQDPDSGPVTHPLDTDAFSVGVAGAFRWKMGAKAHGIGYERDKTGSVETNVGGYAVAAPGMAVRRLTPIECERLQGFPPGWTAITFRGKPAADGNRYRALGNAMCCNVVRWIGRRIGMAEPEP